MTALAPPRAEERVEAPFAPPAMQQPAPRPTERPDTPRTIGGRTLDETASYVGSALAALALAFVIYEKLMDWSGGVGFLLFWWALFLATYAAVSSFSNPRPIVVERIISVVVMSGAGLVALALGSAMWHVFSKGYAALVHINFYTQDMAGVRPTDPLTMGGVKHAIVGTIIQVGIAVAISLPLGVGTAVYMTEVGGRLSRTVRTVVEAMTALPDILAGLFIYALLIIEFGWSRTGLTASLALVVTIIPIIARSAEVVLRVVPGGLREASLALGASQWQTVWRVVLPTARSGLTTAVILGIARIAGETAPLLIVSGASTFLNTNPVNEPMNSLPLFIISAIRSGQPIAIQRAYGAAALLLMLVLVLFVVARFLARDKAPGR
ncbi:phosphate transport system permease protein [Frankineae bacterium MT45]|nr:phosphate transport system permease protein [Frankineae bacterium MT45]